jgi:hypothetical protein
MFHDVMLAVMMMSMMHGLVRGLREGGFRAK